MREQWYKKQSPTSNPTEIIDQNPSNEQLWPSPGDEDIDVSQDIVRYLIDKHFDFKTS